MPVEYSMALICPETFSFLTRQYSATPRKVNQILSTLMPQALKPAVRKKARVDTLLAVTPGRQYSTVQTRHTKPILRKVAA